MFWHSWNDTTQVFEVYMYTYMNMYVSYIYDSQTKWSAPLKIALMNWLFETWTR